MKSKIIILTPVYKDWQNLDLLLSKINIIFKKKIKKKFDLVIIDDFSNEQINFKKLKYPLVNNLKIIKLHKNLGSQRAIAIGLKFINENYTKNYQVIIIDSDGQDNPKGIIKMLDKANSYPGNSIVVKRGQRKENLWFRILYEVYCLIINILAFKKIRYGNYSLLTSSDTYKITLDMNLWNAYPPTLCLNSKALRKVTMNREKRFSGDSKMNFYGLVYHALKVFSVLRFRILLSSSLYLLILYFTSIKQPSSILFSTFIFFFIIFNFLNYSFSFFIKENYFKSYKKIKVIKF